MSNDRRLLAGNWKMNTDLASAKTLAHHIVEQLSDVDVPVVVGVPYPFLAAVAEYTTQSEHFHLAAQNCHQAASGAYTGEVSVDMLASVGCDYVIVGHSERRDYFGETDELINSKVKNVLAAGMRPIFCCGEQLSVREGGRYLTLVEEQLRNGLFDLDEADFSKVVVAYEPVWAIGTGRTASPEQAQEMHAHLRKAIRQQFGESVADQTTILYGGSVKPANAIELFGQPDVDGGLVGGASLDASSFVEIIRAL